MKRIFDVLITIVLSQWPLSGQQVEATLTLATEMPAARGEALAGVLTITNIGRDNVRVINGKGCLQDQVRFYADLAITEQERMIGVPLHGISDATLSREDTKINADYTFDTEKSAFFLSPGESQVIEFDDLAVDLRIFRHIRRNVPIKAEMYTQPNNWIPIKITPPLVVDCAVDFKWITPISARPKWGSKSPATEQPVVSFRRATVGTNDFLFISRGYGLPKRVLRLNRGDSVIHTNKTGITVLENNGNKREIQIMDIGNLIKQK